MSYIREQTQTLTLSTVGGSSAAFDSAGMNGFLHSVRLRAGFATAAGQTAKLVRITSSGSTEQVLLSLTGATFSSGWTEHFPRATVLPTTLPVGEPYPIGDAGLRLIVATTSGLAGSDITAVLVTV